MVAWLTLAACERRELTENAPDTLSLASFLRNHCERGFYICDLRNERVTVTRFQAPDTLLVVFQSVGPSGARYTWGLCCGSDEGPDSVNALLAVPRGGAYAVRGLPLYIP